MSFTEKCLKNIPIQHDVKFSRHTLSVLKILFRCIDSHYQNLNQDIHSVVTTSKVLYETDIIDIKKKLSRQTRFLKKDLIQQIADECKYMYKYSFVIQNRTLNIQFITKQKNQRKMNTYFKFCYLWFLVISKFSTPMCPKVLDVTMYMSSIKKMMPSKDQQMDTIHVNSAFTYGGCRLQNEITIFRKEEWLKVLMHESIHAMGMDFSFYDNTDINNNLQSIFPLNITFNAFEAYTETWAIIWHNIFYAYLDTKSSYWNFIKSFKDVYLYECYFSYYQLEKVLSHHNMKFEDLYIQTQSAMEKRQTYSEKTSIFSYYILKTILLQHMDDFLHFCCLDPNIMKVNTRYMNDFIQLIIKNYHHFPFHMKENITSEMLKRSLRFSMFDIV